MIFIYSIFLCLLLGRTNASLSDKHQLDERALRVFIESYENMYCTHLNPDEQEGLAHLIATERDKNGEVVRAYNDILDSGTTFAVVERNPNCVDTKTNDDGSFYFSIYGQ